MEKYFKRTTLLCIGLTGLVAGLALARFLDMGISGYWCLLVLPIAVVAFPKRRVAAALTIVLVGLAVGAWRGGHFLEQIAPYKELAGEKVTVQVQADSSAVYGKASQIEFDASHIKILEPYKANVPGMMLISGFGENSVLRGDVLTVSGKIYLKRGSKSAGISFGQLHVVSRSDSILEKFRRGFLSGLNTALPEPHNQFAAGILIGQRSDLPASVSDTLRTVGLSHVIAVSGYNLTIMAEVARRRMGRKSKYRNTLVAVGLILIFLGIAGSSASIARAAFVSLLTVGATHYGRSVKPLLLILLAAAYTAFMNPLNLWVDIGWYLSFLAFFGVLIVAPAIHVRYFTKNEPGAVVKLLIETSSAQLMTIPIVMFIFGEVSLVSLIANLLVVPLVPLAMLLSVVAGLAGMWTPMFASLIAWPARMLLGFMLAICSLLARIPHAMAEIKVTAGVMILAYSLVVAMVVIMRRRAPKYDKIVLE